MKLQKKFKPRIKARIRKNKQIISKNIDNLFEWIQKKNLKVISSVILLIVLGILAQLGIIPKLIT